MTARAPNLSGTDTILKNLEIPSSDHGWIKNLRGKNIHNGAAAVIDYRTGEVLAYVGSGSYSSPGNAKFSPSSTCCRTAGANRDPRSSRSTTRSASRTGR